MTSQYAVLEQYPDGGLWRHHFHTIRQARQQLEAMRRAHPARSYTPIDFEESE